MDCVEHTIKIYSFQRTKLDTPLPSTPDCRMEMIQRNCLGKALHKEEAEMTSAVIGLLTGERIRTSYEMIYEGKRFGEPLSLADDYQGTPERKNLFLIADRCSMIGALSIVPKQPELMQQLYFGRDVVRTARRQHGSTSGTGIGFSEKGAEDESNKKILRGLIEPFRDFHLSKIQPQFTLEDGWSRLSDLDDVADMPHGGKEIVEIFERDSQADTVAITYLAADEPRWKTKFFTQSP